MEIGEEGSLERIGESGEERAIGCEEGVFLMGGIFRSKTS